MIEAPRQFEPISPKQATVFTVDILGNSIVLPIIPAKNPLHPNLPRYGVPAVAGLDVWGSITPDGRYATQVFTPKRGENDIDPLHPDALAYAQPTSLTYSIDQAPDIVITSTLAQATTERLRLASLEQKQGLANKGRRTKDPLTGDYLDDAINRVNMTLRVVLPETNRRATAEAQIVSPYAADHADQIAFQQRAVLANGTGPEAADAQRQLAKELSVPLIAPLLKLGREHPKLGRVLLATSLFLSACGGASPKSPDIAVTIHPTATAIRPTEAPRATFTAIPPSPTVVSTPTQEAKPSATPISLIEFTRVDDIAAQLKLFAGSPAGKALEVALADRAKDLKPLVVTTASGKTAYPGYSTGIVQLGISGTQSPNFNPDNSHLGFARETNKEGDIRIIFPSINEKDTSFTLDPKDPTKLQLVSLKYDSSGLELRMPQEFVAKGGHTFGINGATGHITIINREGIVVSQVYLFGIDGKRPDWKTPPETADSPPKTATPTPVVAGGIFSGTTVAEKTPTATPEAEATVEAKRMQAMRLTDNVSVLSDKEYITNPQRLMDALRKSNPEAEKIMNDYFVSALTALIDHNPTPSASRIAEVQTKLAAARKEGKPFLVEENLQEVAGWDSEGKPLFPTPSEQAAKPYKIDFSKPVVVIFETEKDLEMRLKRGGTGSVDSRVRTAIDPKNGQLYISKLVAPNLVDNSVSAFDGNRDFVLAFYTLAQPPVSFYWASDSSASQAPLVSIPKGFTDRGQAPVVAWNRAHGNDFDTKR